MCVYPSGRSLTCARVSPRPNYSRRLTPLREIFGCRLIAPRLSKHCHDINLTLSRHLVKPWHGICCKCPNGINIAGEIPGQFTSLLGLRFSLPFSYILCSVTLEFEAHNRALDAAPNSRCTHGRDGKTTRRHRDRVMGGTLARLCPS